MPTPRHCNTGRTSFLSSLLLHIPFNAFHCHKAALLNPFRAGHISCWVQDLQVEPSANAFLCNLHREIIVGGVNYHGHHRFDLFLLLFGGHFW